MSHFLLAILCVLTLATGVRSQRTTCPASYPSECYYDNVARRSPGQADPFRFLIGGLFDVHMKGETAYQCGNLSPIGLLNLEAFFWAIDGFAKSPDFTDIGIGAVAFDSCMRPEQSIAKLTSFAQCELHIQEVTKDNLVAVVGPYSNEDARRTGAAAQDLGIILLSPSADAMDLSQETQGTLLSLSPSFEYDLMAIVQFLEKRDAGHAIVLYSGKDTFWKAAYDTLVQMMDNSNICVQQHPTFDIQVPAQDLNEPAAWQGLINRLVELRDIKYIVPLMSKDLMMPLFEMIEDKAGEPGIDINNLIFILNSHIGRDRALLASLGPTGSNTIVIDRELPTSSDDLFSDFKRHIMNIKQNYTQLTAVVNPWIENSVSVSQLPDLDSDVTPSPYGQTVARTLQAVKSIFEGMKKILEDCNRSGNRRQFCDKYRNQRNRNDELFRQMRSATGVHQESSLKLLNDQIKYKYYLYTTSNSNNIIGSARYVGNTFEAEFTSNLTDENVYREVFRPPICPSSIVDCCIPPTTTTTRATTMSSSMRTDGPTTKPTSNVVVVMYPKDQEITGAYTNKSRSDDEHDYVTRFDLNHKWIIALGVLAGLGILCVIVFEIYILYKLLGTRAGTKWRTMWLGQLLLFGLFLCYLVLFAYLFVPTKATCGITRFGVGVSYAVCFSVLLVKLMVILTSKPSDVLLPGDMESPNYLKGIYQFLMFIFAVGVQVVIDTQWLITIPPEAVQATTKNNEKVWICNHYTWLAENDMMDMDKFVRTNFENHLLSLIYIMCMILIITFLALKSHGIITNHRESVFIGIAAGFSIPIWLAWGLVGGLKKDDDYGNEYGDACIAFGLFLTATLILFAMFLPKVRQLVNMGVEGIYLEDDRDTYYGGSVIMAPPSYKSKGPPSVIYVNNQGIYSEPVVIGNGDPSKEGVATHLKYPSSTYSAPPTYLKRPESAYGGSTRVLRVTDDLKGGHPKKRPMSEVAYGTPRPRSHKGTLPRSRSSTNLGAL